MYSLDSIPMEIFHLICFYLNASDVAALKTVHKTFNSWLGTTFWKKRVLTSCPAEFPCISGKPVDWISCAVEREYTLSLFGPTESNLRSFFQHRSTAHGIDAMHVPPDHPGLLLVGDRGRVLSMFSLSKLFEDGQWMQLWNDIRTHMGWIWTIKSLKDTTVTGSWDGTLRSWAISDTGLLLNSAYKLHAPVLCSSFLDPNTIAASAHHSIRILDLRIAPEQQQRPLTLRHQKVVLCMEAIHEQSMSGSGCADRNLEAVSFLGAGDHVLSSYNSFSSLSSIAAPDATLDADSDPLAVFDGPVLDPGSGDNEPPALSTNLSTSGLQLEPSEDSVKPLPSGSPAQTATTTPMSAVLYSGSDDHTLAGWDLRNPSKPVVKHEFINYPRKISLMDNSELWVAEHPGRIHVFDIRHGRLDCVHTNELPGWVRGFGGFEATPGGIYACGLHDVVEVFHPTKPIVTVGSRPIAEKISGSPTCMTYRQGTLLVGSGDGSVYIWTSKDKVQSVSQG